MFLWLHVFFLTQSNESSTLLCFHPFTTLDVIIHCVILHVKVLPLGVLLLEVWDGQRWKDQVQNCAPCHLSHVDSQQDPSLAIVPTSL